MIPVIKLSAGMDSSTWAIYTPSDYALAVAALLGIELELNLPVYLSVGLPTSTMVRKEPMSSIVLAMLLGDMMTAYALPVRIENIVPPATHRYMVSAVLLR